MFALRVRLLVLLLVGAVATPSFGDIITTRDRKKYEGRILRESGSSVTILTYSGEEVTVERSRIKSLKKKKSRFDDYDAKVKKEPPKSAEDHYKLGKWCKSKKLTALAKRHFEKTIELDPANDNARKAMGMKKIGGKWVSAEEARRLEAVRQAAKNALAIEVKLTVPEDIPKARLKEMADLFASFSDDIWLCAAGNAYIKSVTARDNANDGNVRIEKGAVEKRFIKGGGVTVPGSHMRVAGCCSVYTFVHEGGHLWFGLPDEYKSMGGGCPACVMVGGNMEGFGPGKWKFCTASNHTGPGIPCWQRIKKRFPKFTFPNPDAGTEPPFETKVVVNNSGN